MRIAITMPKTGYDMEAGVVAGWLKEVGDAVAEGEPIAEIETEKTTLDLLSPAAGRLVEITQRAGAEVPVEQPIGYLEAP
jgi:pyruvate/2-oxoglutarate dehydrogenase complex dihydrolipoamide acyltransferase (E2) component